MTSPLFDARHLCRLGFMIFPLAENSKVPVIKGGRGCLDATDDQETIARWIETYPRANIGILCGPASNLVVVDIDVKADAGGEQTYAEFEKSGRIFPPTCEVLTPSGGRHLYYRYHPALAKNSIGRLGKGIDVRSIGGYVVAPPSVINRKPYRWVRTQEFMRRPPAWLIVALTPTPEPPAPRIPDFNNMAQDGVLACIANAPEGQRNCILFWGSCRHAEYNWSVDGLLPAALKCGLPKSEAKKTIQSGLRRGRPNA